MVASLLWRSKMIEELYSNPFLTIALTAIALFLVGNFGLQVYMLNGPPIVIEKDLSDSTHGIYGLNGAAGFNFGPLIFINPTSQITYYRVLRHEYQHYMQCALLSPAGFSIAYLAEKYIWHHDYDSNWFELDAHRAESDKLSFNVYDWNFKTMMEVSDER